MNRSADISGALNGPLLGTIIGMRARQLAGLALSTAVALTIGRLGFGSWGASLLLLLLVWIVIIPLSGVRDRRKKREFGLSPDTPTEATREIKLSMPPELALSHASDALAQAAFVKPSSVRVDRKRGAVRARTRLTWDSFGERLTVTIVPTTDGAVVQVESRGLVPQFIDYGKNARNVAAVTQLMSRAVLG
jgi:hypothetical protein